METLVLEGTFDSTVRRQINSNFQQLQFSPGETFWVDVSNGVAGDGTQGNPFRSIVRALLACETNRGDVVKIMPGSYDENVVVTKNYVSLVGAIPGRYGWPDIVPSTGIPLVVSAQGFIGSRARFAGTAADSVRQEGNGFFYDQCIFDGDGTASKAGARLSGNATNHKLTGSEGLISNSLFRGCALGLVFDSAAITGAGVGPSDDDVFGNRFYSNTIDIATAKTGAGGVSSVTLTRIMRNSFEDKNKAVYIDLTTNADGAAGGQTGTIMENYFASDTMTTTTVKMVGTGFTFVGNYDTVGVVDGSGLD